MYFDYIAFFSNANFVGALVFIWVLSWGIFFYFTPRKYSKVSGDLYWKAIAFAAEIMVIGGLLGLFTFAGRTKIEIRSDELRETQQQKESQVIRLNSELFAISCDIRNPQKPPFLSPNSIPELCDFAREHGAIYKDEIDWDNAINVLSILGARHGVSFELESQTKKLTQAIKEMKEARHMARLDGSDKKFYQVGMSWEFILICALSAMLGVAMKCARASKELVGEFRKWRSSHCSS